MIKTIKYWPILISLAIASCAQPGQTELERQALTFIEIISNSKDIEAFIVCYNDPVLYSDPVWGVIDEHVSVDTLKRWFEPVFDPKTGWDFEINAIAIDAKTNTFAIKGYSLDKATKEKRLITSWFKIENGKIKEQMGMTPWSVESLKYSPRFKEALKHLVVETDSAAMTTE